MNKQKNKDLDTLALAKVLATFNLKTTNYTYFKLAFTHSTYANENACESNERIEFLGDSILGFLTAEYIYKTFPKMHEGQMTKIRATYVCEDANYAYATALDLDNLLLLGVGEELSGGREKKAVVADSFECFLGAVYLTFNLKAVKSILEKLVFPNIKNIDNSKFYDYKTKLQEYIQADTQSKLEYVVVSEVGKPNDKVFTIAVKLDGLTLGVGSGKSKKQAGQQAAKAALEKAANI